MKIYNDKLPNVSLLTLTLTDRNSSIQYGCNLVSDIKTNYDSFSSKYVNIDRKICHKISCNFHLSLKK